MGNGGFIPPNPRRVPARYSRWSLKRHHSSTLKQIGLGTSTGSPTLNGKLGKIIDSKLILKRGYVSWLGRNSLGTEILLKFHTSPWELAGNKLMAACNEHIFDTLVKWQTFWGDFMRVVKVMETLSCTWIDSSRTVVVFDLCLCIANAKILFATSVEVEILFQSLPNCWEYILYFAYRNVSWHFLQAVNSRWQQTET